MNKSYRLYQIIFITLLGVFVFVALKNLQYPLLWNDEGETVMFAQQVLDYGLPFTENDKNDLFTDAPFMVQQWGNKKLITYNGWSIYYFSSIGVMLAELANDIYWKTFYLRLPFALAGLAGIFIPLLLLYNVFKNEKKAFFIIGAVFLLIEILSVSVQLHLREVRYYSLTFLLVNSTIFLFVLHHIYGKFSKSKYNSYLLLLLFLLLNTFFPVFIILAFTIGIWVIRKEWLSAKHEQNNGSFIKQLFRKEWALVIMAVLTIPISLFYKVFSVVGGMSERYDYAQGGFLKNLKVYINFFLEQEFLIPVLCCLLIWLGYRLTSKKEHSLEESRINKVIDFLLLFVFIYTLIIPRSPYMMERMFIYLQPIFILIGLLSGYFIIKKNRQQESSVFVKPVLIIPGLVIILLGSGYTFLNKWPHLKGRQYEMFHQYKGVLDHVIPFVKENFNSTKSLVIATNYEEFSFMYYLQSKVIIGFLYDKRGLEYEPDVIVYRKGRGQNEKLDLFNVLLQRNKYKRIDFPVYDNLVNNIPQLYASLKDPSTHLYQTLSTNDPNKKTSLFVKAEKKVRLDEGQQVNYEENLSAIPKSKKLDETAEVRKVSFHVDQFKDSDIMFRIRGWAYLEGIYNEPSNVSIYLQSPDTSYFFTSQSYKRPDIMEKYEELNTEDVGYEAVVLKRELKPGDYNVGIMLEDENGESFLQLSKHKIFVGGKANLIATPIKKEVNEILYSLDKFNDNYFVVELSGWAKLRKKENKSEIIKLFLNSDRESYVFETFKMNRPDLYDRDTSLYDNGFSAIIYKNDLKTGVYRIGFITKDNKGETITQNLPYTIKISRKKPSDKIPMPELPQSNDEIRYAIDKFADMPDATEVVGWAYIKGISAEKSKTFVCLVDGKTQYVFQTTPISRKDVSNDNPDQLNVDNSGFSSLFYKKDLKPGSYRVGIYIENFANKKKTFVFTDNSVEIEGEEEE